MRTLASLLILCVLMFNLGCQTVSTAATPIVEFPVTPSTESPSALIPTEAGMQNLIDLAMADLAQRLAIPLNEIVLLEAESVTWPDGSLGCPQEGMEYAQVLTPGYLIRLQWRNQEFEYHASRGTTVIFCENPTPPVPGTPADT